MGPTSKAMEEREGQGRGKGMGREGSKMEEEGRKGEGERRKGKGRGRHSGFASFPSPRKNFLATPLAVSFVLIINSMM